jgi:hypothetical protein
MAPIWGVPGPALTLDHLRNDAGARHLAGEVGQAGQEVDCPCQPVSFGVCLGRSQPLRPALPQAPERACSPPRRHAASLLPVQEYRTIMEDLRVLRTEVVPGGDTGVNLPVNLKRLIWNAQIKFNCGPKRCLHACLHAHEHVWGGRLGLQGARRAV